ILQLYPLSLHDALPILNDKGQMGLKSAIKALWRRKWMLVLVPLATMLVVFVIRLFGEWKYTSTAQIATGITTNRKLAETSFSPEELDIEFNNLITLIKSPQIISQVSYLLMQHDIPTSSITFRHPSAREISDQVGINLLAYEDDFRRILDKKIETRTFLDASAS